MQLHLTAKSVAAIAPPIDVPQELYWDTETKGFGLVVGRTSKSFVWQGRLGQKKIRKTIGSFGQPRDDGLLWTVQLARQAAEELRVTCAKGEDPRPRSKRSVTGVPRLRDSNAAPTLRDGMEAHLERMRTKKRAQRSIETFEYEMNKYLGDWLDRPFSELDGPKLREVKDTIKANAANHKRIGTNEAMEPGAYVSNRVIAHVSASWRSLNRKLEGKLGHWNPASSVDKDAYTPKREIVVDLPAWADRVTSMRSPVRRDGLMFTLYTGLRHEDVRSVRWDHIDFKARTLHLPDPKGGETKAFTIPLAPTALRILRRRRESNGKDLQGRSDNGWAFPALNFGEVGAISDLRELHGDRRFPEEDVHTLRRTFLTAAAAAGVSELDRHVLANHSYGRQNVNQTYIAQSMDHLHKCARMIDVALTKMLKKKRRA